MTSSIYNNFPFQIIRINVNIAIVDMISPEFKGKAATESECFLLTNATMTPYSYNETMMIDHSEKYLSFERRILDYFEVRQASYIWRNS